MKKKSKTKVLDHAPKTQEESAKMLQGQKEILHNMMACHPCLKTLKKEILKTKKWLLPEHFHEFLQWVLDTLHTVVSDLEALVKELLSDEVVPVGTTQVTE